MRRNGYTFDQTPHEQRVANLESVMAQATDAERAHGLAWYEVAATFAMGLSTRHDVPAVMALEVLAILSPGCEWERNMALAETFLATGDCRHMYGRQIESARRLVAGVPWFQVTGRASKVDNFRRCILLALLGVEAHPFVCLDRHAHDAAMGRPTGDADRRWMSVDHGRYEELAEAYREVAARHGLQPYQTQAIVWVTWRRLKRAA